MRFKSLFSTTDNLGHRDQEMQRRGGLEEDSDYEEGVDMVPDDMRHSPVHLSAAARRAWDKLHQDEVWAHQGDVRAHQAEVHQDQLASGGESRT
jgi:hypothetical protein